MKAIYLILFVVIFGIPGLAQSSTCLPSDVKDDDVVSAKSVKSKTGAMLIQKITVKQTLKKLSSRCVKGKLFDGKGREIRFYFVQGCWGNPPADYLEILENQKNEIARLKKLYTVIEMTCDRSGMPRQSIL